MDPSRTLAIGSAGPSRRASNSAPLTLTETVSMRFLIVDDSKAPLKILAKLIAQMGHQVVGTAHNGQEAVDKFQQLNPDVVVMDVIMPRLNGLDALDIIHRTNPRAKVVMASSLRSCDTAMEAERRGASFFLCKPYQESHLRQVVARLEKEVPPSHDSRPAENRDSGPTRPSP